MKSEDIGPESPDPLALARISTGIGGLDTMLMGGFLAGGIYLVMGSPGAGKTILANQLAFHHVRSGGRVVYVTLLAESHSRLFSHLQLMGFFDIELITQGLIYLSAFGAVEKKGLDGLLDWLRQVVRKNKPTILILDGVAVADELSSSATAFKKFVQQINTLASGNGCTTFLLSSMREKQVRPEHTMVDGIVSMDVEEYGMRTVRELEVRKFRGSNHLHGRHSYQITENGIRVYPRLESRTTHFTEPPLGAQRASTHIAGLDAMLGGGFPSHSTSVILGASGTGKTVLGLHFLKAGVEAGESCLYFGFYESPSRLVRKAAAVGLDFGPALAAQHLQIMWQPPLELYVDALADQLLENIRARKVTRLFLDGIDGLRDGGVRGDRLKRFMVALTNELRTLGVTTLITEETRLFSRKVDAAISDFSAVTENLLFVKQVEVGSSLSRAICLIKVREGAHDYAIRELRIVADQGIVIGEPLQAVEETLTGQTRATGSSTTTAAESRTGSQQRKNTVTANAERRSPPKKSARRS